MVQALYEEIAQINEDNGLEIDLDCIAELYGEDIVQRLAEMQEDVAANIAYLIELNFGETVSDICNRFGILLCEDPDCFRDKVRKLVSSVGEDYAEKMAEDMSCWESLL